MREYSVAQRRHGSRWGGTHSLRNPHVLWALEENFSFVQGLSCSRSRDRHTPLIAGAHNQRNVQCICSAARHAVVEAQTPSLSRDSCLRTSLTISLPHLPQCLCFFDHHNGSVATLLHFLFASYLTRARGALADRSINAATAHNRTLDGYVHALAHGAVHFVNH